VPRAEDREAYRNRLLTGLGIRGIALPGAAPMERPGAVSVFDGLKVSTDFQFLRTTRQAVQTFLPQFDPPRLGDRFNMAYLHPDQRILILRATSPAFSPEGLITVFDAGLRPRLEVQVDLSLGFSSRAGHEFPGAGLRLLRVWELRGERLVEHDLREEG